MRTLIALSLFANVVLGSVWLRTRTASDTAQPVASNVGRSSNSISSDDSSSPAAAGINATGNQARSASWKDLQTRDLAEMVRRLRNVGCPEQTIQDLILAEVNREYAARRRSVDGRLYEDRPYWKGNMGFDSNTKDRRETVKKQRELEKEKSDRLVELLGVDPEKQRRKEDGQPEPNYYSFLASRVDYLPESKKEAALNYLGDFEEKMQDFYRDTRGLWDGETRAEQRRLEAERLQGLSQFLTPEEVREYELRNSQLANQLTHDLQSLSISREQYEVIFDLRKKYGDSIYNYADSMQSAEARAQVEQNKNALTADLTDALGTDFAKQYERAQDYSYQQLARLANRNDLPSDTASAIYDVKDNTEQSIKAVRDNPAMTPDQRQQALQEIRTQTEAAIKSTLGDALYQKYVNNGGWWIQNLVSAPPPKH